MAQNNNTFIYGVLIAGEKYNKPPVINFDAIFETSSPNVPIVFILSPGTEPANDLMKLADKVGMGTSKLKMLAMGQGQEKVSHVIHVNATMSLHTILFYINSCLYVYVNHIYI